MENNLLNREGNIGQSINKKGEKNKKKIGADVVFEFSYYIPKQHC